MVRTVLIINSRSEDRAACRRALSQNCHDAYEFREEASGGSGLVACLTFAPDCILLASQLPDMSGLEFLAGLQQPQNYPVIMTGVHNDAAGLQAIRQGAQDYLLKGDEPPEYLCRVVQKALERAALLSERQQVEERLRLAFDTAQMGYWEWDIASNIVTWDGHHERLFGLTLGAFAGTYTAFLGLVHPDDREMLRQRVQRTFSANTPYSSEFRIVWPSGEVRWMIDKGRLFRNAAGQPIRMVGVVRDITDRKRAEETLTRYRLLSEHTRDIVLFIRANDGRIIEANQAALAAYRYDHATLLTKSIHDLRDPATHEIVPEQINQADTAGLLFETHHCRSDGSTFPVEVSSQGADIGGERLLLSLIRDITERKQAEESLRQSQERLQTVLRAGRMGWWERDLQTDEVTWSNSFFDLLGQSPKGNRPTYDMYLQRVYPDDRQKIQERIRRAIDEREAYSAEYRLLHPNGGLRWILEKGRIFYDPADQPQRIIGVSLDITQRKWIEEALNESEAILRSFYDNAPMPMGIVEIRGDDILHLYDNTTTHRFLGLAPHESTTGRWTSQLGLSPAVVKDLAGYFRECEASNQPVHFEYLLDSSAGPRWLAATIAVIGLGSSGRTRFCYIAEDITERKQAEDALRESEQWFRELADLMPQLVWTSNSDGVLDYYNSRVSEYAGGDRTPDGKWRWEPLLHPDDLAPTLVAWQAAAQNEQPYWFEHRLRMADGSYRWHLSRAVPVRNAAGAVVKWFGTATDIHDLRLIREAL